jgi:hypothetical protein
MRRILRKIAENDFGALGDTSTLADPSVVDDLIENRDRTYLARRRPRTRAAGRNDEGAVRAPGGTRPPHPPDLGAEGHDAGGCAQPAADGTQ